MGSPAKQQRRGTPRFNDKEHKSKDRDGDRDRDHKSKHRDGGDEDHKNPIDGMKRFLDDGSDSNKNLKFAMSSVLTNLEDSDKRQRYAKTLHSMAKLINGYKLRDIDDDDKNTVSTFCKRYIKIFTENYARTPFVWRHRNHDNACEINKDMIVPCMNALKNIYDNSSKISSDDAKNMDRDISNIYLSLI